MFEELEKINARPKPFEFYTAADLWTDHHTSERMLGFHLNPQIDVSSRNAAFIERSVEWIAARFNVAAGKRAADFGCGPGLYTTRLAARGADVTGIDFSQRSIEHARQVADLEGLAIRYENRNYLDFETADRFDLILMIMCDFCALSPVQRKRMLGKFYALLEPGGCVLLDVFSLAAFHRREERAVYGLDLLDGFWSSERYYAFLNTFKYEAEKVALDKYTIVESGRTRTVYNWLQYFRPRDLAKEFAACGFKIEGLYADVAGTPFDPKSDEFAVVAGKSSQ